MANVLSHDLRLRVLAALLDGNSVRATSRMTGVHQDTISRFALAAGQGAASLHNRIARGLNCSLVEVEAHWQQMDLFLWKDQEKRMDHFGNHDDDDDV